MKLQFGPQISEATGTKGISWATQLWWPHALLVFGAHTGSRGTCLFPEGRFTRQWLASPKSAGFLIYPQPDTALRWPLQVIAPPRGQAQEGPQFIKSPWGKQVLSTLTSSWQQSSPTLFSPATQALLSHLLSLGHNDTSANQRGEWFGKVW